MQSELGHSEIDIIEYYGAIDSFSDHYTIHIWPNSTNDPSYPGPVFNSEISKVLLIIIIPLQSQVWFLFLF